jgi:hypothetical protein
MTRAGGINVRHILLRKWAEMYHGWRIEMGRKGDR